MTKIEEQNESAHVVRNQTLQEHKEHRPDHSKRQYELTKNTWETGEYKHRVTRHRWDQSGAGLTLMSTGDTGENNQEAWNERKQT